MASCVCLRVAWRVLYAVTCAATADVVIVWATWVTVFRRGATTATETARTVVGESVITFVTTFVSATDVVRIVTTIGSTVLS
jgi:hypothetical protein